MSKRQHERKDGRRAFQHSVLCMEGGQGVCGAVVMAISATKATKMDRMFIGVRKGAPSKEVPPHKMMVTMQYFLIKAYLVIISCLEVYY